MTFALPTTRDQAVQHFEHGCTHPPTQSPSHAAQALDLEEHQVENPLLLGWIQDTCIQELQEEGASVQPTHPPNNPPNAGPPGSQQEDGVRPDEGWVGTRAIHLWAPGPKRMDPIRGRRPFRCLAPPVDEGEWVSCGFLPLVPVMVLREAPQSAPQFKELSEVSSIMLQPNTRTSGLWVV